MSRLLRIFCGDPSPRINFRDYPASKGHQQANAWEMFHEESGDTGDLVNNLVNRQTRYIDRLDRTHVANFWDDSTMQFRLRTLFIITAVVAVFCGLVTAPPFIAIPVFCALSWLAPAYWIPGVIYAREGRRAFFIGGIASGAIPYLVQVFYTLVVFIDDGWRIFGIRNYGGLGDAQIYNFFAALLIFAPVVMAYLGGWISLAVYHSLQTPGKPPTTTPFAGHPSSERT